MATAESVLAKIQALIDSSNSTTGGSDTNLTTAINALITGYNAGGLDTSDATAVATNIETGKTAYVNGIKVTGELPYTSTGAGPYTPDTYTKADGTKWLMLKAEDLDKKIIGGGKYLFLYTPFTNLGTATAADVTAGKTFTSAAGLLVEGTNSGSGGGSSGGLVAKSGSFTADNETSHTISTGLSSISYFIMKKDGSVSSTGFVIGSISSQGSDFNYAYCSSYSQYVRNFTYTAMSGRVSGGDFTYSGSSSSALIGTISWTAIGTE